MDSDLGHGDLLASGGPGAPRWLLLPALDTALWADRMRGDVGMALGLIGWLAPTALHL